MGSQWQAYEGDVTWLLPLWKAGIPYETAAWIDKQIRIERVRTFYFAYSLRTETYRVIVIYQGDQREFEGTNPKRVVNRAVAYLKKEMGI